MKYLNKQACGSLLAHFIFFMFMDIHMQFCKLNVGTESNSIFFDNAVAGI